MLIDEYLPRYDVWERHSIKIEASAEKIYETARTMDFRSAYLSNFLCRLRGLSPSARPTLDDILKKSFVILGEKRGEELLLGITGKFWTIDGGVIRVAAEDFKDFDQSGYAKAVWYFSLCEIGGGVCRLDTETCVFCTDKRSRRWFQFYWFLIGTFSSLIRREILCAIKREAEAN